MSIRIIDLTALGLEEEEEVEEFVTCPHCDKAMVQTKQDIVSPSDNTMVLAHKSQYYCSC